MITTSRRTNPIAEDLFSSPDMRQWADDVLVYNRDSRSVYNAYLGAADVIICTEDSGKMLTESVASGRPVLSVRPPKARHSNHVKALVARFEAAGYLKRVPIEQLATEPLDEFIANHAGPPEPLMKRVREEVNEFLLTLPWAA
jgi:mitochondrial fission protein ELM1